MTQEEKTAWDQYYSAAVIATSALPVKDTGSPLDSLSLLPMAIANRAAGLADLMLKQRQERIK
ncbi:hypothetical protein [Pseudomonas sp. 10S4]|uniref:hypothetical protein n=1 Tax=Pseudomonas sp. 10S4 TaxID=3048583 RepID=UPI002AC9566F|nr:MULTISPECIES: hypothetical protein [unclassified Pseudomonas]MEB0226260.1 hypothetical protein [Pseudomonas sp. 5S1]MEB0294919.1 hypothetical protein [Pseudomonas sp. 10S4]WPX18137.1 hypothetical protein RHM58_31055 [Pseudomonas sp. 10S4]